MPIFIQRITDCVIQQLHNGKVFSLITIYDINTGAPPPENPTTTLPLPRMAQSIHISEIKPTIEWFEKVDKISIASKECEVAHVKPLDKTENELIR